jgi:acetoin utilization deacetylase AcuC-like enzyme
MKTGFFYSPDFLLHENGDQHPEHPARLRGIETVLRETGQWDQLIHLPFAPASEENIALCHTLEHIERVKTMARAGGGDLDADTHVNQHSFDVALLASGAAIEATRKVISGELDNAFVAERPCGHHAESGRNPNSPWGFCLFNHAAIAARYAQRHLGIERVAILDFDVHHGNGTQEIFYEDPTVFFASLHQSPLFPNTGTSFERGEGLGVGTTLNFPLPADTNGLVYRVIWAKVGEAVRKFQPQLIILSAGFDAHIGDPLAGMALTSDDFAKLVLDAKGWANELCDGRLVAVLEGGYKLTALAESVAFSIQALMAD